MTQTISVQKPTFISNYEEDNWDDIEFPKTGLLLVNDNNDYGLLTTTRDISGIHFSDDDSEEEDYFGKFNSNKSTPASSVSLASPVSLVSSVSLASPASPASLASPVSPASSTFNKVKEISINSGVVITNNKEKFPGLITRIRGENSKVIAVGDDWDNDMEIPEDGFSNLTITTKKNRSRSSSVSITDDFEFDSWDEEEEQNKGAKNSKSSIESFDDDFDFSVSSEVLKLHQRSDEGNLNDEDLFGSERYSSRNSSCRSILSSPAPTNGSQSAFESGEEEDLFDGIQFPEHTDSLILINYNDDDDFESGLDIGDLDLLKNKNIVTRPSSTQQKNTKHESFSIEFSRPAFPSISRTSGEVRPKTTSNNSTPIPSLQTDKTFSKFLPLLRTPTIIKNTTRIKRSISHSKSPQHPKSPKFHIREIIKKPISLMNNTFEGSKNTNSNSKPSPKKTSTSKFTLIPSNNHIKSTPKIDNIPNLNSNTNSILEIMREPKRRQSFGDGTELDEFDDLLISINRENSYTTSNCTKHDRMNNVSSVGSKIGLQHRRKRKNRRKRKKPQLIRNLNADKNLKVVGDMVYNPITHRWDGNDSVLKEFGNALTSPARPALISNMNNRTINTRSLQMVGKMKFDPIKMCWNNDSSDDEEIWARFDYDDQNPPQASDDNLSSANINHRQSKYFQVGSEFDVTPGFLAALLASERQHRNEITRWYPDALNKKDDSIFSLRDTTLQTSYLYDLRNNNNSKICDNRPGGLFRSCYGLKRHEQRHFR